MIVRHVDKHYPEKMQELDKEHNITGILGKIERERGPSLKHALFWVRSKFRLAWLFRKQ